MNPRDANTWHRLQDHPAAREYSHGQAFDPSWYDGDPVGDLARLRSVALELCAAVPTTSVEMHVEDDFTFYMNVTFPDGRTAFVYPTTELSGREIFYVELSDEDGVEHYPPDVAAAVRLLTSAVGLASRSA